MSEGMRNKGRHRRRRESVEGDVGRLLGLVPPPSEAPEATRDRIKAAAREEWLEVARERHGSYLIWIAALAATLVGLLIGVSIHFLGPRNESLSSAPATLEVALGRVLAFEEVESGSLQGRDLEVGDVLPAGVWIETSAESRAALRLAGGQSLRLDTESRLHLISSDLMVLESGGIYVDSPPGALGRLEIRTPIGIARDIGTQFELRIEHDGLRIRVREGEVELEHSEGLERAKSGGELTISEDGKIGRRAIAVHGSEWNWSLAVSPEFDLEGSDVRSFLDWVSRETGWRVQYSNPAVELAVSQTILHGSLEGVPADLAPSLVLETCGVGHRLVDGELLIDIEG